MANVDLFFEEEEKRAHLAPVAPGGGNTISPPCTVKRCTIDIQSIGNAPESKKRSSGAKRWPFTWNNYPENWLEQMAPGLESCEWAAYYEVGKSGTPHLQGYVEFPIKVRPAGYMGIPTKIHWGDEYGKPCNGNRAANLNYVSKDGKHAGGNLKIPRKNPKIEIYGWQLECAKQLEREYNSRDIFWWWSEDGLRGKSSMVRWLVDEKKGMMCSGKASDMKNAIMEQNEKDGGWPDIVVFDVPRDSYAYLSYTGIEEIKNGVFYSSKYKGGQVSMPWPHVFVFCNFAPEMGNVHMSDDRFIVNEIV